MGGPSLESYRAAKAREEQRLAAMRTRDGVVDLSEWRAALSAVEFLRSTHGQVPAVLGIRLRVARDVGFELEVTLVRDDEMLRRCLPNSVNYVPVRIVVRNPAT